MKKLAVIAVAMLVASPAFAQYGNQGYGSNPHSHQTDGYTTNRGTYVQPHQQTNPNNTQYDNYSTRGNTNPYTGQQGTRTPKY